MPKQTDKPRAKKASVKRAPARAATRQTEEVTEADFERQLELAALIEARLQKPAPTDIAQSETFKVTIEDGKIMSGCDAGDERKFLQWFMGKAHCVLTPRNDELNGSKLWLMEAIRAALLSCRPKTPIEAMLTAQCVGNARDGSGICRPGVANGRSNAGQ